MATDNPETIAQVLLNTGSTTIYTVPAATNITGKLFVCNTTAAERNFRLYLRRLGAAESASSALFYNASLGAYMTAEIGPLGATATDILSGQCDGASALGVTLTGVRTA